MSTFETISLVVAVVSGVSALVLGILNYVHQRDTSRPRLVVRPRVYDVYRTGAGEVDEKNVAVMEICNVGQMSVIGSTIRFLPRWQWVYEILRFLPKRASGEVHERTATGQRSNHP
jgi:hypothetical protein